MLTVSCPRCDRKMQASDEYVGKTADCSSCGHKFVIEGTPTAAIELAPHPPASRASSPPPLPREKQWHYAVDGVRLGPAGASEMSSLIAAGRITPRTLVWSEGMGDWKEVRDTELLGSSTPPPLPGQSPPNGPAWVLALLPSVFLPVLFLGMAVSTESDGSTLRVFSNPVPSAHGQCSLLRVGPLPAAQRGESGSILDLGNTGTYLPFHTRVNASPETYLRLCVDRWLRVMDSLIHADLMVSAGGTLVACMRSDLQVGGSVWRGPSKRDLQSLIGWPSRFCLNCCSGWRESARGSGRRSPAKLCAGWRARNESLRQRLTRLRRGLS